jgi:hypothetical protein
VPVEKKMIYQRWYHPFMDWYWLVAEYDAEKELAFGFVHGFFDEWGYISIRELLESGAELDRDWKPCTYKEAMAKIAREKKTLTDTRM